MRCIRDTLKKIWKSQHPGLGGAVGLVLFALGYLLSVRSKINRAGKQDESNVRV